MDELWINKLKQGFIMEIRIGLTTAETIIYVRSK
ncbi:MAG: hypothetical protein K0S76_1225 [Herbinix sp.]|jgi:hypothetical protein|nr:hypothetical protein [Herbinix sp.]